MVKLVFLLMPAVALAYEYGPDPRYTAAPGDHPLSCASAQCHTGSANGGPINAGGGSVTATFSSGSSYTPGGAAITITVSVSDPKNTHFGFQMTARLDSNQVNGQAGDFNYALGAPMIVLCDDGNGSVKPPGKACVVAGSVEFIEHAFPAGSQVSTTPYTFTWTPPAMNVGPVHFYVAGNAVNGNLQADAGDHVYTASYVLTPALCPSGTPTITNVISAGAYGAFNDFASGSWLEVYGSNFASNQQQWQSTDFTNGNAPTSLAGISVSINGKPGYVWYVSGGQINVEAPADTFTGMASVIVTCSASSPPFSIQELTLSPGLLAPQSFLINGTQYLVAFHEDGTYVGNVGLVSGLTFSPAKPGETITTYGVGFGDVTPAIAPGVVVTGANTLANPLTLSFGSSAATLQYQGLAPGYVGLYQFNVVVPSVANGDIPINVTQKGAALKQKLVLTVHN